MERLPTTYMTDVQRERLDRVFNLGYTTAFQPPEHLLPSDRAYSERQQIAEDVESATRGKYEAAVEAVRQMQLDIPIPAFEEWQPEAAELVSLQAEVGPARKRMRMLDGLNSFVGNPEHMGRLLPQQRKGLRKMQEFMEFSTRMDLPIDGYVGKSGFIDMPTGTGKTGVLTSIARALKSQEDPSDPVRVLVLTPTQQLVRQTVGNKDPSIPLYERKGFARFAPSLNVASYYAYEKNFSDVTVMTNASFNMLVQNGRMPEFDVVLIDESHTDLGFNIMDSVKLYYPDKITVGFSATPDYHEEKMTAHLLEHEIYALPLADAIEDGMLAPITAEHRELEIDISDLDDMEDSEERTRIINRRYFNARLRDCLPDIREAIRRGDSVLVRCPPGQDTSFAKRAADILRKSGTIKTDDGYAGMIRAVSVGGSTQNPDELDILLDAFNTGKVHVICYVDAINMGTDLPPAKLLADLYPMESSVKMKQGIGRVLRLVFKDELKQEPKRARVITYKDKRLRKQYTCEDALRSTRGNEELAEAKIKFVRGGGKLGGSHEFGPDDYRDDVTVLSTRSLGRTVMEHGAGVVYEHTPTVKELSFDAACDQFGIPPETMAAYLEACGYEEQPTLAEADYRTLIEVMTKYDPVFSEAKATKAKMRPYMPPPSAETHMEATELAERSGWRGTITGLVKEFRGYGVKVEFRWTRDGKRAYYIPRSNIADKHL